MKEFHLNFFTQRDSDSNSVNVHKKNFIKDFIMKIGCQLEASN